MRFDAVVTGRNKKQTSGDLRAPTRSDADESDRRESARFAARAATRA